MSPKEKALRKAREKEAKQAEKDAPSVFQLPVYGPADVFPMMPEDELSELAADIEANGLREPLVVADIDGTLVLVDGRNRRAACEIAGEKKPPTKRIDAKDAIAFVISANVHRRHLTKGQRAMAVAKIFATNNLTQQEAATASGLSQSYISKAKTVLEYAPDLSEGVISGARSLEVAYEEARERKKEAEAEKARLLVLRTRRPELADKVVEGELALEAAEAETDAVDRLADLRESHPDLAAKVDDGELSLEKAPADASAMDYSARTDRRLLFERTAGCIVRLLRYENTKYAEDARDLLHDEQCRKGFTDVLYKMTSTIDPDGHDFGERLDRAWTNFRSAVIDGAPTVKPVPVESAGPREAENGPEDDGDDRSDKCHDCGTPIQADPTFETNRCAPCAVKAGRESPGAEAHR